MGKDKNLKKKKIEIFGIQKTQITIATRRKLKNNLKTINIYWKANYFTTHYIPFNAFINKFDIKMHQKTNRIHGLP